MNDYEMLEQRVERLRRFLTTNHKEINVLQLYNKEILKELLNVRRQITRAAKERKNHA